MNDGKWVLAGLGAGLVGGLLIGASTQRVGAADAVALPHQLWVNAIRMTVIPLVVSLRSQAWPRRPMCRRLADQPRLRCSSPCPPARPGSAALGIGTFSLLAYRVRAAGTAGRRRGGGVAHGGRANGGLCRLADVADSGQLALRAAGAMLPLVLFMLLLLAIARSPGGARDILVGVFRSLSEAMLVLVRWIVRLAPIGVFALMMPLGAHGGAGLVGAIGFYILAYSLASVLFVLLLYPLIALVARVPMRDFARAALPAQLIAFSSSSSIAALPALVRGAEDDLGLRKDVTGFVLPLAISMFKFAAPVSWTFGTLFVAWFYQVALGPTAYATIALATIFLGFVAPGVPRGAFLMLAPLFLSIGLPIEGIGILIAVDAIPDLFATVLNASGDLAATVIVDRR